MRKSLIFVLFLTCLLLCACRPSPNVVEEPDQSLPSDGIVIMPVLPDDFSEGGVVLPYIPVGPM